MEDLRGACPGSSCLASLDAQRSVIAQGENVCGLLSKGFTPGEIREMNLSAESDAVAFEPLLNAVRNHLCPTDA